MTMLLTLSCTQRFDSLGHDFNGKLKISTRPERAINFSLVTAFPRSRVSCKIFCCNLPSCPQGTGWSRQSFQGRPHVVKEESRLGTRWSQETVRNDMFSTNSGHNSWLGKFLKLNKSQRDEDTQETAIVDVHIRFSLSQPKFFADAVSNLASPWFKLLRRAQPVLPLLLQNGGGGNRDGGFFSRLDYGGDDDSEKGKGNPLGKKNLLSVCQWLAVGVAFAALAVWTMRAYSGVPQRIQFPIAQFVDGVFWLGLMWCIAAFFLWTARMLVRLTPSGQGNSNVWKHFRAPNALSSGREFVLTSKLDEWMAQNVVAIPGLVISLFLLSDLMHYGKNLNLVSRCKPVLSRIFQRLKSPRVGVPRTGSLFSRGVSTEKWRRGSTSPAKRRRL